MEVQIISTEIIKPSSPTPPHLKTHKLTLLDQLAPDIYFPLALFYSNVVVENTLHISQLLKKSLSKTLTYYYPFAGRIKDDNRSVDCDDYGVPFIEARVACNMFDVLKHAEMEVLEKILPFRPQDEINTQSTQVNMALQVNYFDCGGLAICVNTRHVVADGAAALNFIRNWAALASASNDDYHIKLNDVVFDCTSIFPPHDSVTSLSRIINRKQRSVECMSKKFTFDAANIAALRKKISEESSSNYRPTRFEAVVALIWAALIAIDRESTNFEGDSISLATIPVNLRNRMNPPLPEHCIGNMYHAVTAEWLLNKAVDYNSLGRKVHDYTKMVSDGFVRKVFEGGASNFVKHFQKAVEGFVKSEIRLFGFSGPIGLPYYEIDFGWGKPVWFTTVMRLNNIAMLLDTRDGKGVEAWVGLPQNDMLKFEQDHGILTYASFNSSCRSRI